MKCLNSAGGSEKNRHRMSPWGGRARDLGPGSHLWCWCRLNFNQFGQVYMGSQLGAVFASGRLHRRTIWMGEMKKPLAPSTETWHLDDATAGTWIRAAHLGRRRKLGKGAVISRLRMLQDIRVRALVVTALGLNAAAASTPDSNAARCNLC